MSPLQHPPFSAAAAGATAVEPTSAIRAEPQRQHGTSREPAAEPAGPAALTEVQDAPVADASAEPCRAAAEMGTRPRRRARRRDLRCPLHPEQKILSVSPKHHLYVTDVGQLMLRGLSKRRADELLAAYRRVLPITDEWIECFWCDGCGSTRWWHVKRRDRHDHSLSTVPRELWEQATGVIRVEGNPTVSQFSRRQARASGVHGMRQYRFL